MNTRQTVITVDKYNRSTLFQASSHEAVTPSDTTVLTEGSLFVGTGGDIKVKLVGSATALIYKNIQSGTFLPLWVDMVYTTDTTATDIIIIR